jgi:hypothetical protein
MAAHSAKSASGEDDKTAPWSAKAASSDWRPWPWSLKDAPLTIKELIGRPLRVVREGDLVTQEYVPGRITLTTNATHNRIVDIHVEPGEPNSEK